MSELIWILLLYAVSSILIPALILFPVKLLSSKIGHRISVAILLLCALRILIPTGLGQGLIAFEDVPFLGEEKKQVVILQAEEKDETEGGQTGESNVPSGQRPSEEQGSGNLIYVDEDDLKVKKTFRLEKSAVGLILLAVWASGFVLCLSIMLIRQLPPMLSQKKRAKQPSAAVKKVYLQAAATVGLKKLPTLLLLEENCIPHLTGVFHPTVYMGSVVDDLNEEELFYIFCHELTHYKRRDTLSKLLLLLTLSVFWWNPLIYYFVRITEQEIECACDEQVLKKRTGEERCAYGETILQVLKSTTRKNFSLLCADFGKNDQKVIFTRFKTLLDGKKKRGGSAVLTVALTLFLVSGVLFGCAAEPQAEGEKQTSSVYFYMDAQDIEVLTEEQLLAFAETLEVPEKEGYVHDGWRVRKSGDEGEYSIRFEPVYTEAAYELTLESNSPQGKKVVKLLYKGALPTPAREGYTFGGWYADPSLNEKVEAVPAKNATLYARWQEENMPADFIFTAKQNGDLIVSGYEGKTKNVVIPAYVGGKPVVAVGVNAFSFKTEITSLTLPSTVTCLGAGAFRYCYGMKEVRFGGGITSVDNSVFEACYALKTVYYGGSNEAYGRIKGALPAQAQVIFEEN